MERTVLDLEGWQLGHAEAVMAVVMEHCDVGSLAKAIRKQAFRPHGRWTYHMTYVRRRRRRPLPR